MPALVRSRPPARGRRDHAASAAAGSPPTEPRDRSRPRPSTAPRTSRTSHDPSRPPTPERRTTPATTDRAAAASRPGLQASPPTRRPAPTGWPMTVGPPGLPATRKRQSSSFPASLEVIHDAPRLQVVVDRAPRPRSCRVLHLGPRAYARPNGRCLQLRHDLPGRGAQLGALTGKGGRGRRPSEHRDGLGSGLDLLAAYGRFEVPRSIPPRMQPPVRGRHDHPPMARRLRHPGRPLPPPRRGKGRHPAPRPPRAPARRSFATHLPDRPSASPSEGDRLARHYFAGNGEVGGLDKCPRIAHVAIPDAVDAIDEARPDVSLDGNSSGRRPVT